MPGRRWRKLRYCDELHGPIEKGGQRHRLQGCLAWPVDQGRKERDEGVAKLGAASATDNRLQPRGVQRCKRHHQSARRRSIGGYARRIATRVAGVAEVAIGVDPEDDVWRRGRFLFGRVRYPTQFMKGKSDYATAPISDEGLDVFMTRVGPRPPKYVVCDAYGGSLAEIAPDATAFAHRSGTLFCLQYGSVWSDPADTQTRLDDMRQFYASLRPYMSGGAYVNYCDLDLPDYATAYWGAKPAAAKAGQGSLRSGQRVPACPKRAARLASHQRTRARAASGLGVHKSRFALLADLHAVCVGPETSSGASDPHSFCKYATYE